MGCWKFPRLCPIVLRGPGDPVTDPQTHLHTAPTKAARFSVAQPLDAFSLTTTPPKHICSPPLPDTAHRALCFPWKVVQTVQGYFEGRYTPIPLVSQSTCQLQGLTPISVGSGSFDQPCSVLVLKPVGDTARVPPLLPPWGQGQSLEPAL